jgi:glycosyltransferase involved in cell wall biosynthesis
MTQEQIQKESGTAPLVSIVMATWNRAGLLPNAIASVQKQSFTDWELIIVNDCSPDNTEGIILSFAEKDKRIVYIKNEKNMGFQKSLSRGVGLARSEFIGRIDDDDVWADPQKLSSQIDFMSSHPDCVLVGTAFRAIDVAGRVRYEVHPPLTDAALRRTILKDSPFGHSTVLMRKSALSDVGGYNGDLRFAEDYDLWLRLGNRGTFANLPQCTVDYLIGGRSQKNARWQIVYRVRLLWTYGRNYPGRVAAWLNLFASAVLTYIPGARSLYDKTKRT